MLIPHHKIDEVLARADILGQVGRYVQLKKAGREYKGCCPFHNEKSPSFYVNAEKRRWNCFGCGIGGDLISFLMRIQGRSFVDTVRDLAKDVHVDLEGAEDPLAQERTKLRQVNETAGQHFAANMADPKAGKLARDHLAERGITEESIRKFGLGYAPDSWNDLSDRFVREGAIETALKAGLVSPRQKGGGHYDTFRGRLMIPIRSPEGRTIAFGGRALLSGENVGPKYLNTRDSPLYQKSEVLYGLDVARDAIRRSGVAILVEGYFDAIGLVQGGIANAVAICSTTVTPKQLDLLQKHGAKEIVLLLDGDAAGARAVERLAAPILAGKLTAKVAVLPEGQDPDDFVIKQGAPAMKALLDKAPPLTEHLLQRYLPHGSTAPWEEKVQALQQVRPLLETMPQGLERTLFIGRLAAHFGVPEADVKKALGGGAVAPAPAAVKQTQTVPVHVHVPVNAPPVTRPEELLCALLLADPTLATAPGAEAVEEIRHLGLRNLIEEASRGEDLTELWAGLEPRLAQRIQRLRGEILDRWPRPESRRESVAHAAREVRLVRVEERQRQVQAELKAFNDLDPANEDLRMLLEEQQKLRELRTRLTAPPDEGRPANEPPGAPVGRQG